MRRKYVDVFIYWPAARNKTTGKNDTENKDSSSMITYIYTTQTHAHTQCLYTRGRVTWQSIIIRCVSVIVLSIFLFFIFYKSNPLTPLTIVVNIEINLHFVLQAIEWKRRARRYYDCCYFYWFFFSFRWRFDLMSTRLINRVAASFDEGLLSCIATRSQLPK